MFTSECSSFRPHFRSLKLIILQRENNKENEVKSNEKWNYTGCNSLHLGVKTAEKFGRGLYYIQRMSCRLGELLDPSRFASLADLVGVTVWSYVVSPKSTLMPLLGKKLQKSKTEDWEEFDYFRCFTQVESYIMVDLGAKWGSRYQLPWSKICI